MVSKRKKPADKGGQPTEKSITLSLEGYEALTGRLGEPLFLISILVFLLTALRLVVDGWMFDAVPKVLALFTVASIYFTSRKTNKTFWTNIIPLLVFVATLFSWYAGIWEYPASHDYPFFSLIIGIMLLFASLSVHGIIDWEIAAVLAIVTSALVLHMVPAFAQLIGNLDSYWQYKWMQGVYAGDVPEYDNLVYPMAGGLQMSSNATYVSNPQFGAGGHGLVEYWTPMLNSVTYAVLALVLKPFGFTLYDIAMLLPGVLGGLAVIPMYLLVKEMFSDMRPHNKIAGLAAAFVFMLSPGFSINGTAANCEDDVLGMFIMLSSFYLFFASVNRRSFKYAILAGVGFLMLRLTWAYTYAYLTIGVFGIMYSIILFAHRENCTKMMPYLLIAVAISELSLLFMHPQGELPAYHKMPPNALFPIAGAIGLPILLEALRIRLYGAEQINVISLEDKVDSIIRAYILPLSIVVLAGGFFVTYVEGGPLTVADNLLKTVMAAKVKSIVHQTVSEQNPMADDLYGFFSSGYNKYGLALFYAVLMIPVMIYLALKKRSTGALFLLTWAIPMMWGSYNKSAWIFAASPSATALGATIGLYAAVNRKELDDWRIVGTIMLLFMPLLYIPFFGAWDIQEFYSKFVGYIVMHMALTPDIYYWQPMLEWAHNNTAENEAIITWWDYGHWITAVSKRPVLIDNLQADYYEIQDVARFFVNKTSEEEAFKTIEAYNDAYKRDGRVLKYVAIDWTMIGKGSALHYIANGDIDTNVPADPMWGWRNYGECVFIPDRDMLTPKIVNEGGKFYYAQKIGFGCTNYIRGVVFTLAFTQESDRFNPEIKSIDVLTPYGDWISWSKWAASSKASLLGVQSLRNILLCASQMNSPEMDETSRYVCRNYPMYHTLVYVPDEFNDFMMTRLYLMQHVQEYNAVGLYTRDIKPLKHFRMMEDFSLGYVRVYEISYDGFRPEETQPDITDILASTTNTNTEYVL